MDTKTDHVDFLIIGAGICGITTAITLIRLGYSVKLFEEKSTIQKLGAGLTLWSNAVQSFSKLGMEHDVIAIGSEIDSAIIYNHEGKRLKKISITSVIKELGVPSITVGRGDLLDTLMKYLGNVVVFNKKFRRYEEDIDGVVAHFEDRSQYYGTYLIGCDGINSEVRRQLYLKMNIEPEVKRYSGYAAWRALVHLDEESYYKYSSLIGEYWGNGTRFGLTSLTNNRIYFFAVENISLQELKTMAADPKLYLEELEFMFSDWKNEIRELISYSLSQDIEILYHPIFDIKPNNPWHQEHILLLGDAAHATTPNMGQGACLAIEDSCILGELLKTKGEKNISHIFNEFEGKRRKRVTSIVNTSWRLGRIGQSRNRMLCWLRNTLARITPAYVFKNRLRRTMTFPRSK